MKKWVTMSPSTSMYYRGCFHFDSDEYFYTCSRYVGLSGALVGQVFAAVFKPMDDDCGTVNSNSSTTTAVSSVEYQVRTAVHMSL